MSPPAMSFGDRFCVSRKGGMGGDWVGVQTAWPCVPGLSYRNAGSAIFLILSTNGMKKQSSHFLGPTFLAIKAFSQSRQVLAG